MGAEPSPDDRPLPDRAPTGRDWDGWGGPRPSPVEVAAPDHRCAVRRGGRERGRDLFHGHLGGRCGLRPGGSGAGAQRARESRVVDDVVFRRLRAAPSRHAPLARDARSDQRAGSPPAGCARWGLSALRDRRARGGDGFSPRRRRSTGQIRNSIGRAGLDDRRHRLAVAAAVGQRLDPPDDVAGGRAPT